MPEGRRILALLTDGFGSSGGIGRYNCDLLRALSLSPRVEHVSALPRFGAVGSPLPAKIEQAPAAQTKLRWAAMASRLALTGRFDVVFCGHMNAVTMAAALARAAGARLWLQAHGIEAWEARSAIARRSVGAASLVTAVSRFTRARLLAWTGLEPERIRVLPNTLDARFGPRPRRYDLVAKHGLSKRRVILTVGRLDAAEQYKGHDRIIGALTRVALEIPDVAYLVVGSGDDLARLSDLARQRGVGERVIFAGAVADTDLPDYFALGDVYAMPSTGEGFGIVFLEAAASGLTVIGGNRDGSADALSDGALGRMVDPFDAAALAEALIAALREHRGATGESRAALQRFAFSNFARHVDDVLGQLSEWGTADGRDRRAPASN